MYSMTGWGRSQNDFFSVNVRGVNSKYKEIILHLPPELFKLEREIYKFFNTNINRGRVDVFVNIDKTKQKYKVVINKEILAKTYNEIKNSFLSLGIKEDIPVNIIFDKVEGILIVENIIEKDIFNWKNAKSVFSRALDDFLKMKKREGEKIIDDVKKRVKKIEKYTKSIKSLYKKFKKEYIKKSREKIQVILNHEQRKYFLNSDIVEVLDKYDITEEIVRILSHIKQVYFIIKNERLLGKKLDFLCQEINREVNTIASKVKEVKITQNVINIKEEIDKIREQLQNLE